MDKTTFTNLFPGLVYNSFGSADSLIFERLPGNDFDLPKYQTEHSACFDFRACLTRTMSTMNGEARKPFVFDLGKEATRNYDVKNAIMPDSSLMPKLYIDPCEIVLVPSGFKTAFGGDKVLKIFIRSSFSLLGLSLANYVGIIDADYRGEIFFALKNTSKKCLVICHGDRVCQGMLLENKRAFISEGIVDTTERSVGGFGSTGV